MATFNRRTAVVMLVIAAASLMLLSDLSSSSIGPHGDSMEVVLQSTLVAAPPKVYPSDPDPQGSDDVPSSKVVAPILIASPRVPVEEDPPADDSEEQFFTALPVSSPLNSAVVSVDGKEQSMMFRPRGCVVEDVKSAARHAKENIEMLSYSSTTGRSANETLFDWDVKSELFKSSEQQCLVVITLSRPRSDLHDKYREMVNEHAEWEGIIANDLGPDAFRVVAKSEGSVELGTTIFSSETVGSSRIEYISLVKLTTSGTYRLEVEHLHRAYGAFTDVDRRGSYCPLPPSPGKGRMHRPAQRPIDFDNRVREKEGRFLVEHDLSCNGIADGPLPAELPVCDATMSAQDLLDGRYLSAKAALGADKRGTLERNFSISGEEFVWAPRSCRMRYFSSTSEAGALYKLLQEKHHRILFLGDSQMRTLVNAYFSVLFNEPAAENNRGEYRKEASVISSRPPFDVTSTLEFLWDPQGEIITRFDLIMSRNVRQFEKALKRFLIVKKLACKKAGSSMDLPHSPKTRRKKPSIIDLPSSCYTPEGVSWKLAWKYGKKDLKPSIVVIGFGGWNMWLCESFDEAEERLAATVESVKLLRAAGTEVIFAGWPAPIDSLAITAAKRRMTSSRIGLLMELTRIELAAAGVIVLPFFEMALAFPHLSSKHSASHYDNTTILYGLTDYISTFL